MIEEQINKQNPDGIKEDGSPYRVMIVDDSMFVTKQLKQILHSEEYKVVSIANDGSQAFEQYKDLHLGGGVDIVTMDITMPKMNGIEALKRIMEFDSSAKVIMISAIGKQDLVRESLVLGAKNYIVKPLKREKVLERIRNVLY